MARRASRAEAGLAGIGIPPIQAWLYWPAKLLCSRVRGGSSGARGSIRQSRLSQPTENGLRGHLPSALLPEDRARDAGNEAAREHTPGAPEVSFPPSEKCATLPRPIEPLVTSGKSAQSDLSCLSTTAIDEPRELARMDCPPGLLVGPGAIPSLPALSAAKPQVSLLSYERPSAIVGPCACPLERPSVVRVSASPRP